MKKEIRLSCTFNASSKEVFEAWLDSEKHSSMTGGIAICSDKENQPFSAWDGYISGVNKKIVAFSSIIQSWRTTEFKEDDLDSELSIYLNDTPNGCVLNLIHSNISANQSDYEKGWIEHYFEPMKSYFNQA